MKRTNVTILTLLLLLTSLGWSIETPAQTQKNKYACISKNGVPRTVVDTKRGKIELIVWKSTFFGSNWPVEKRCEEVTKRFQEFSDGGNLRYITTGKMNGSNVICVGDKRVSGYQCMENGLLITLQPNDKPNQVMNELFDISSRIKGGGLERGGALDLNQFLLKAPLMQAASPGSSEDSPPLSNPGANPTSDGKPSSPDGSGGGIEVPDILQ